MAALVIVPMVAGAVTAAQGAGAPKPGTGHAVATITLPRISFTDPTGAVRTLNLGALGARSATDATPAAAIGLNGVSLLGNAVPDWGADASSGPQDGGSKSISLSATGVTGALDLIDYALGATSDAANADLSALTASLAASPLGLHVDLGQHGIAADVTKRSSTSTITLSVNGAKLSLGDLLSSDVLDNLTLTQLLQMLTSLNITLPVGADTVLSKLGDVSSQLNQVRDAATALAAAQQSLATALANNATTQSAEQTLHDAQTTLAADLAALQTAQQTLADQTSVVSGLQAQVDDATATVAQDQQAYDTATQAVNTLAAQVSSLTLQLTNPLLTPAQILSLQSQLADAQNQLAAATATQTQAHAQLTADQATLAGLQQQLTDAQSLETADQGVVTTLQQTVAADQTAVDTAQTALDTLTATLAADPTIGPLLTTVSNLTTQLTSLLSTLTSMIGGLPDLAALRSQLAGLLANAPLIDLGTVAVTVSSAADDTSGRASVACTVTGASVLGGALPDGACAQLVDAFTQVTAKVRGALATLPLATAATPTLGGLAVTSQGSTPGATDTVTSAQAGLTPLHLAVPSLTLAAAVDTTVTTLDSLLTTTQSTLSGLGLHDVTSSLTGVLGTLTATVGALPTGGALAGLRTLGADISLIGVQDSVVHNRPLPLAPTGSTRTPAGSTGSSGSTGAGATGSTGAPGGSTQVTFRVPTTSHSSDPSTSVVQTPQHLPFTGDNSAVELAAALLTLLVGAHLVVAGRRRTS